MSAARIIQAHEEAQAAGLGAFALDDRMVDMPVVRMAEQVLDKARAAGMMIGESVNWRRATSAEALRLPLSPSLLPLQNMRQHRGAGAADVLGHGGAGMGDLVEAGLAGTMLLTASTAASKPSRSSTWMPG